jgi:hypothetical protein
VAEPEAVAKATPTRPKAVKPRPAAKAAPKADAKPAAKPAPRTDTTSKRVVPPVRSGAAR